MDVTLAESLHSLFGELNDAGYAWEPLEPSRLKAARERDREGREPLPPLVRRFGLGVGAEAGAPLVARVGRHLIAHDERAYLGAESSLLARLLLERAPLVRAKRVLDLGSGAGALSLALSDFAEEVLGLELSARAVELATATARAQGVANASFACARIGARETEARVAARGPWDVAVFNPPMAVPSGGARPSRDGGPLGIEVPLAFLEFARRAIVPGGHVLFLATNPILADGRTPLFERIFGRVGGWEWVEKQRLHADFNRALHRQDDYASLGVKRIELWFLHARAPSP